MQHNPKRAFGLTKPSLSLIPTAALIEVAGVMELGAKKYGPFNWREDAVEAQTYIDAANRHILSWWDGEELDPESGQSHLAHAMSCMAILLDAKAVGKLKDNRPPKGAAARLIKEKTKKPAQPVTPSLWPTILGKRADVLIVDELALPSVWFNTRPPAAAPKPYVNRLGMNKTEISQRAEASYTDFMGLLDPRYKRTISSAFDQVVATRFCPISEAASIKLRDKFANFPVGSYGHKQNFIHALAQHFA